MILLSVSSKKVITKGVLLKLNLDFGAEPWSLALQKAFEIHMIRIFIIFSQNFNSFSLNSTFPGSVTITIIILAKL